MNTPIGDRLEAIHAMLTHGSRSVRLEQHTLILWGLAVVLLIFTNKLIFTADHFPVVWQRVFGSSAYIAMVLTVAGIWDFRLTRRARRRRDETLSFVQLQLQKVWWLIVGLIVLLNLGMNFFGGGYMFYGIVLALMGLAFYVHGLFSEQLLSWIGLMMMAMGLASVALKVPFPVMEWLAIFMFGLGLPALALLLERTPGSGAKRGLITIAWAALVIVPTGLAAMYEQSGRVPVLPVLLAGDYVADAGPANTELQIVRLPAGTVVPVQIAISGDVVEAANPVTLPLRITRDLDVLVQHGELEGRYRIESGSWLRPMYNFHIRRLDMKATLRPPEGPAASLQVQINTGR